MRYHPGAVRRFGRGGAIAAASAALIATGLQAPAHADERAAAALNLRTPFDCGQVWNANTRSNHNPTNSVDFQRSGASGKNVLASGAGKVTVKRDLGGDSYGKYLVIDHGGGWQTLYAHLKSFNVNKGASVKLGAKIGAVGSTGGSTGPHLHYEQKKNGTPVKVVINNVAVKYFGNTSITSSTNC